MNKFISGFVAGIIAVSTLMQIPVSADSASDVVHLSKALTTADKLIAADDYNKDGVVNAIDLTLLKRDLLAAEDSGEVSAQTVTGIEEHTKLIGRTMTKDGVTWLVHSGSAAECTVTGNSASVTIVGDGAVFSDEKYRPRYGVYVDGELIKDVVMGEKEQKVELFSGDKKRTATVKIMHLSEANNGAIGVKQFDVTSSSSDPVKPTAKKDLTIEFIGDSITCAYGVGADNQYVGFETATEDFSKSYAYLTAELIGADYSAVSYSGHGIISGYTSDGKKNADLLVPPVYENVAKNADYAVPWDFSSHPSDVIVLNLGTNDDSYASKDLKNRAAEYQAAYVDFLKQIRKCNPDSTIICTLGIMGCEELYPYIEAAVKDFGDSKVTCYQSPTQNINGDGIGADWHPSAKTHQLNAYLLADKICSAIGRKYSRVGVDFAADGEYGADIDKTNGANAWPYFAEWNKSLNVNITAGGASAAEITAYVRGLDLPAGSYELTFAVKGADKIEFPFAVRNTAKEYCKGTASGTAGKAEFTLDTAADGCEIVFLLGELESANLTFENIKLYKTA